MSFKELTKSDFNTFTVVTNPSRTYVSSSSGVEGSLYVFAQRSSVEKDLVSSSVFTDSRADDAHIESLLKSTQNAGHRLLAGQADTRLPAYYRRGVSMYLDKVNVARSSKRKAQTLDVIRFVPPYVFTTDTARKLVVKELLNDYYKVESPSMQWAYSNYHTLNFFTASSVPSDVALLYPAVNSGPSHDGYVTGSYALSGAFSFDFYVNPRYKGAPDVQYTAGTILHLSSSYALSVISGSARDENGRASAFRLQLQLSHSANVPPSLAVPGVHPNNLTFVSDDNCLEHNRWHHVVVRWGTNLVNDGSGSFNVDGTNRGTFCVPSGTVAPKLTSVSGSSPNVLVLGNYYNGADDPALFFAADPALREGLQQLNDVTGVNEPDGYSFLHPLKAELHDVAIKRYYMSDVDIAASSSQGPRSLDSSIAFYVPPFFVTESPFRQFVGDSGGVPQTPFYAINGTTDDPFNVAMSFGVGGHLINVENFLRDFASDVFPRAHKMSASIANYTTEARSANDFLYDDPNIRRRNLLVLPCDDGNFVPSFELLASESLRGSYVDDLGIEELSMVNLDNMLSTSSLLFGQSFGTTDDADESQFVDESIGFTPETPGSQPGRASLAWSRAIDKAISSGTLSPGVQDGVPLTIYQRTLDPSSNQVTFFDISNLFYDKCIDKKSVVLTEPSLSGSNGAVTITLRDDGCGNLYRADALTSHAAWNSVGNCYYNEGILCVKSPHLFFFGKDQYSLSFKGTHNVHVFSIDSVASAQTLNSSSNPNFKKLQTVNANDHDKGIVFVSGLNFHDENYNVVMKAQLAQPIMKKFGQEIVFRTKIDL